MVPRLFLRVMSAETAWARRSGGRILRNGILWHGPSAWLWIADKERGPTFNAYLNGIGYWARYGASDTDKDRFLTRFGPFELSHVVREGRVDVTAMLTDPTFGADLGTRLRLMEETACF